MIPLAVRAALAASLFFASTALTTAHAGETVRLLVAISANVGDPDDVPLRYTATDAERVRRVFVELGEVAPDRAYVISDQPAEKVRQSLAEIRGRMSELRAGGKDVVLVLYVSAHAKAGVLHLMGTHLPLSELRDFAAGSGARLRLVIVDACDSGAMARAKGGRPGPGYEVALEKLPLHGQVIITSSGPAQASEEWESLRGSLFTHHLLTGLRGDADGESDGKVTLAEAYAYAYRRTVASAARAGQHPAYDMDLAGTGDLVLTHPASARSAVVFPAESSGRYVVASQPRADVVAEVDKVAGRPLRIAVPAGRYLVRKRTGRSTGLTEVEIPFGGVREVLDEALTWSDFAEIALKGGTVELRPWSVLLSGTFGAPPVLETNARFSGGVGVRRTFGAWFARGIVGASASRYRGVALEISERSLSFEAAAGYRHLAWPVVAHVGLAAEVGGYAQSFVRDAEEEIQRNFGVGPLPDRTALSLGAGPFIGAELPLAGNAFAMLEARLLVRHLPSTSQPAWLLQPRASLLAGYRF